MKHAHTLVLSRSSLAHASHLCIYLVHILLTSFFGTCRKNEEEKEYQIEEGDGARRKGIGHGMVPIRCLSVYGQILMRDGLGMEGGVFIY